MYKWIKGHKFMSAIILGLIIMLIVQGWLIAQFIGIVVGIL